MKLTHDEMKALLPEYLRNAMPQDERRNMEMHIAGCPECKEALALLSRVSQIEAPDPGEVFWKTLSQKVTASAREEKPSGRSLKQFFFNPVFAAGVAGIVVLMITYSLMMKKNIPAVYDPLFNSPLAVSTIDYSDISAEAMDMINKKLPVNDLRLYSEELSDSSYQNDMVLLNAREVDRVYEKLSIKQDHGG